GDNQPTVANLTWYGGNQTLSAASIVPAGTAGAISVYSAGTTQVIIDINGYFIASRGPKSMGGTPGRATLIYFPTIPTVASGKIRFTILAQDSTHFAGQGGELIWLITSLGGASVVTCSPVSTPLTSGGAVAAGCVLGFNG